MGTEGQCGRQTGLEMMEGLLHSSVSELKAPDPDTQKRRR